METTGRVEGGMLTEQLLPQRPSSSKMGRIWDFTYECIIKEVGSHWRHLCYRVVFWIDPHKYGLNPVQVKQASANNTTAKVVLLLHGVGAHPSYFLPMAKKFSEQKIPNIYTVPLKQSNTDPVPTKSLADRITNITSQYLQKGYRQVDFALVGHSLGALVASKYIWRETSKVSEARVSMMISIAGRLKYVENKFAWFCEDVKPEIEKTHGEINNDPNKATLYTIWGDKDGLVPKTSVHIQVENSREYTVKGAAHGNVVFAADTHKQVVSWTQNWLNGNE